jgi:hypothetical protein
MAYDFFMVNNNIYIGYVISFNRLISLNKTLLLWFAVGTKDYYKVSYPWVNYVLQVPSFKCIAMTWVSLPIKVLMTKIIKKVFWNSESFQDKPFVSWETVNTRYVCETLMPPRLTYSIYGQTYVKFLRSRSNAKVKTSHNLHQVHWQYEKWS